MDEPTPLLLLTLSLLLLNLAESFTVPLHCAPVRPISLLRSTLTKDSEEYSVSSQNDEDDTLRVEDNNDGDVDDEIIDDENIGAWIPIGSVKSLRGLGPQAITVMGHELVVWETKDGEWSVMADACPHRLAPLSQGRVDPKTNCIECPYHGWQFDTDGTLQKLPQLEVDKDVTKVPGATVTNFPVRLCGDLILAFLPSSIHGEIFPQSMLPEDMFMTLREEMERNATYFVRDLPYSFDMVVENFMDPAHIPFAHHSLQSVRDDGIPIPMKTIISNFTHVQVTFEDQTRSKKRTGIVSFQRPHSYSLRLKQPDGQYKTSLSFYILPVRAGRSRLIYSLKVAEWFPKWILHALSNRFLNSDVWLHNAELLLRSKSSKYVFASQSDNGVLAFRKWWTKHGFSTSPKHTFGPAQVSDLTPLNRPQQLDPWEYHAKHCASCRKALKSMRRVQLGGLVASLLSVLYWKQKKVMAILGVTLGLMMRHLAQKCATLIEGNTNPSEVGDRSVAHKEDYSQFGLNVRLKDTMRKSNILRD